MRPSVAHDPPEPRSRKHSVVDQAATSTDRHNATPMTFFLARGSNVFDTDDELRPASQGQGSPIRSLKDTIDEASQPLAPLTASRTNESHGRNSSRRRSTIKATTPQKSRRESSIHSVTPAPRPDEPSSTPPFVSSQELSLSNSPKSVSSRSIQRSEEDSVSDENRSQAIVSSEDEDEEPSSTLLDSAPQLIMPSIKMPSRRPFTERGKRLGRLKILVTGCKGSGKTSLIKSIVQLCEDIVHVDPLSPYSSMSSSAPRLEREKALAFTEIYASTKPYPPWWSDVEESRILRRRKSMGDSVLERNVCFVEVNSSPKSENTIHYLELQLQKAVTSSSMVSSDLSGLLSGRGGSQADIVLYLISKGKYAPVASVRSLSDIATESLHTDCERIQLLSQIANVVPLIAKTDTLSAEDIADLKISLVTSSLPKLPILDSHNPPQDSRTALSPYTVSSANGPDTETMDASLLMSPEYVQPLIPSELTLLISQIFDPDVVTYLRHTASKKLIAWHGTHPRLLQHSHQHPSAPSTISDQAQSTLASPLAATTAGSLSNSGVLVGPPFGSELSLTTSTSYALARVADHAQREERLAQVRLSKWASDLQISLQRERERYEKLARGDRAFWLIERMGEEIRDGQVVPLQLVHSNNKGSGVGQVRSQQVVYAMHDPLGILRWREAMRTRGWVALQIVGSCGVVGGLAFWLARTWGIGIEFGAWAGEWFGVNE